MNPPDLQPEEGWEEFELPFAIASGRPMFVETEAGPTMRMRFFRRVGDGALVGRVWFGEAAFGPPGFVHGGVVAYVMDEAMGSAAWMAGYPCVAANLNLDFVEMTPLGRICTVESKVTDVGPSKLGVLGEIRLDDRVLARATGVFVRIGKDRLLAVARGADQELPDLSRFDFPD